MGFLDLIQRLGSGFNDRAQDFSQFQQDSADFNRHGANFREIRDNELLKQRFQLSTSENNARASFARADINERTNKTQERIEKATESYQERAGRASMAALSDVDATEMSEDDAIDAGVRAEIDADRADKARNRETDILSDRASQIKSRDTIENFDEDADAERGAQEVRDENARVGFEQAKLRQEIDQRFSMANAQLESDEAHKAADRRDDAAEAARLKGGSPKSRREIKHGAAGGFNNRADMIAKQNELATKGILEDINEDTAVQLQAMQQLTANGGVGLLNPQGQPMAMVDLQAIMTSATKNRVGIGEAAEGLGFTMSPVGQNSSPQLMEQIAGAPEAFMTQQRAAIAEGIVANFNTTFPGILDQAAAGELLDANSMDAIELILETLSEYQGTDWTRYPEDVRDALAGIQGRRASQPVGAPQ